jgi:hypothetical protein
MVLLDILVPYLKGFHLTLAAHMNQRDADGWRLSDKAWEIFVMHLIENGSITEEEAQNMLNGNSNPTSIPEFVTPLPQLVDDIYTLKMFFSAETPPIIQDRHRKVTIVRYGFAEVSGSGFGSIIQNKDGLVYRVGTWGKDEESELSNYREFENVVEAVSHEASSGSLKDSILFLFTDNSTVESALYKGNSNSRKLFELVVCFRTLQMQHGLKIVVSHIAGKRMVAQGTDGVSRGNLQEGVAGGADMMLFVPLHLNASQRWPPIVSWINSWATTDCEILSPADWFSWGHDHDGGITDCKGFWRPQIRSGMYVWMPPPAAAEIALEEMRKAIIKRQQSLHIFICPRLLSPEWRKQLNKAADIVLTLKAGIDQAAWPSEMFEPLTIAFVFPFLPY